MTRLFPHPVLSVFLILLWLMLTRFSLGFLVMGTVLSLVAVRAYSALHSPRPRVRRWGVMPRLAWTLFSDIVWSNVTIARLLLTEGRNNRQAAFLQVRLRVRNPNALALLAIILTATPGTAWVEYGADSGLLVVHIFDGAEAEHYRHVICNVYEPMLMEIFE